MKKTGFTAAALALAFSAGSALAADLPSKKAPPYMPPPPPPMWTGFYVGANVGYGISAGPSSASGFMTGDSDYDSNPGNFAPYNLAAHREGVIGGGQIGYNWQLSPSFVVGLEADFQGADLSSSAASTQGMPQNTIGDDGAMGLVTTSNALNWFGTVRGRLGYTGLDPRVMLYVTGGLAYGHVNNTSSAAFLHYGCLGDDSIGACAFGAGADNNNTKVGWTFGGGLEWAPAALPNWSLKAEYLYIDLPASNVFAVGANTDGISNSVVGAAHRVNNNFHIIRVGLNYHFNFFGSPEVVAKY
jgi:outer membrane immunogenic protein